MWSSGENHSDGLVRNRAIRSTCQIQSRGRIVGVGAYSCGRDRRGLLATNLQQLWLLAVMSDDATTPVKCCSFQNNLAAPEYRKWRRVHGLQFPLHPQQVVGWVVLVGFTIATFLILIPALGSVLRMPLLSVLAPLFCIHYSSHLTALLLDPADPELRALKVRRPIPEFDRSKHAHVIENGRCHLCNICIASPRTKHCSVCNKCVDRFDHHCKWLNHCVGARNYHAFLVCVVSAIGSCLAILGLSLAELVLYHADRSWLAPWEEFSVAKTNATGEALEDEVPTFNLFLLNVSDIVFLVIIGVCGVLAALTAALLLHLCVFHVYISVLGITTYEYIRSYRLSGGPRSGLTLQQQQQPAATPQTDTGPSTPVPPPPPPPQAVPPQTDLANWLPTKTESERRSQRLCARKPFFLRRILGVCRERESHVNQIKPLVSQETLLLPMSKLESRSTDNLDKNGGDVPASSTEQEEESSPNQQDKKHEQETEGTIHVEVKEAPSKVPTLPELPPVRRRSLSELKELGRSLSQLPALQNNGESLKRSHKKNRKSSVSPYLSPIRETGLSNPTSPRRCEVYTVSTYPGGCKSTTPIDSPTDDASLFHVDHSPPGGFSSSQPTTPLCDVPRPIEHTISRESVTVEDEMIMVEPPPKVPDPQPLQHTVLRMPRAGGNHSLPPVTVIRGERNGFWPSALDQHL